MADSVLLPARSIPVSRKVQTLVLGGGVAGAAAAIMSARLVVSTLLVDSASVPGGMSTTGMMSHFTGTVDSRLYEEVLHRMSLRNMGEKKGVRAVQIDPAGLTLTWLELLEEAGAETLFYTQAVEPLMEGNRVIGALLANKDGLTAVLADNVIDATGDGDIAARAGAEYFTGRESDHAVQPATLMFKVAGVDMDRAIFPGSFETKVETPKGEIQALARQLLPHPAGHVLLYRSPIDGVVTVNMTNAIEIDGTSAASLTEGERLCRKQIPVIVDFLREYAPGYENCYVIGTASMLGIRETRHFKGLYTLTEEDILARRRFEDWVVRGAEFNFDVHNLKGASLDPTGAQAKFPKDTRYTIPYRCLIPEKIRGLLLAGRCISGSHIAHSNFRAMPICLAIGEGAGVAAALAAKSGRDLRDVDAAEIQQYL